MYLTDTPDGPALPLAQLEAAVHRRPGDAGVWRALGDAYMAADAFELSVSLLEHAVRLAPRDAETRRLLVVALHQLGRGRDALPHAREAIRLDPGDPADQAFEIAAALEGAGDLDGAADHFRRTIAIDPDQPAAWIRLAFILSKDGKPADAVPVFERAAELRPGSARVWRGLADAATKDRPAREGRRGVPPVWTSESRHIHRLVDVLILSGILSPRRISGSRIRPTPRRSP